MLIRPHKFLLLNLCFQGCLVVSSVQQTYTHSMWIELSFFKILPQLGDTAPKISHLSYYFANRGLSSQGYGFSSVFFLLSVPILSFAP